MPGRLEFGFALRDLPATARRRADDTPCRVLLVADFGGRATRGQADAAALATRRTHRVDLDNLDAVLARIEPRVALSALGVPLEIAFSSLDDFHPDRLIAALPALRTLDETRRRLQDPATFAAAAAALAPAGGEDDHALLGRLLGGQAAAAPAPGTAAPATAAGAVDALLRRIVAPHIVPDAAPQQAAYVAGAEAALADALRLVLHDPALQRVEAAWRGVQMLVTGLELDESLQLHLLDATHEELQADLAAAGARGEWAASGLYQALVQRSRDRGEPWTLIALDLDAGPSAAEQSLLAAFGALGAFCGAPVIAAARPALLGREDFATTAAAPLTTEEQARWQALRTSPLGPWIGLAAPRLLMRRPYGARSDPVERFAFEELGAQPAHGEFLWGPPAFAVALLAARAHAQGGDPNDDRELAELPAVTLDRDGERELLPCAEGWIGDAAAEAMLAAGVMPLVSARHRNAVQVLRVQSIADPPRALGAA